MEKIVYGALVLILGVAGVYLSLRGLPESRLL
jgi:hypothetical protein